MADGAEAELFLIDTCQRRVALLDGEAAREQARRAFPDDGALETYRAADAYAFLLRFASGLESKLIAETEIFGQIKSAWRDFSVGESALARALSPWMQLLFQDAKAVRAAHLGQLGSASYGSQTRRLLGEAAAAGPTLLIGAGQLAQSVSPWLPGSELWLCNRTVERALELARELAKREPARPVRVIEGGIEAELAAWRAARNVVVCIPADAVRDGARVASWRERVDRSGRVLDHTVLSGSGYADLDAGVDEMMRGAQLPPFPAGMTASQIEVSVKILFSLTR